MITISVVLCLIGAVYGLVVLIRDLRVFKCSPTCIAHALPILLGTLAWASAAYTFYVAGIDSPIDLPRIFMIISWCWLSSIRLRVHS